MPPPISTPSSPLLGRRVTTAQSTNPPSISRARATSDPVSNPTRSPLSNKSLSLLPFTSKSSTDTPSIAQYQSQWNLHQACATGNVGLVKLALDHGVSLNLLYNGMHPIHVAAACGDIPILNILYHYARRNLDSALNARRLSRAASLSLDNLVNYNLISTSSAHWVKMNVDLLGATPLHFAVANGQLQAVEWLCGKGARCLVYDEHHTTPLDLAIATQQYDMVKILVNTLLEQQPEALNQFITATSSPMNSPPSSQSSPLSSPVSSSPMTSTLSSSPDFHSLHRAHTVSNDHRMAGMTSPPSKSHLSSSPTRSMSTKTKSSLNLWARGRTLSDRSNQSPWSSRSKSNEKADKLEEWDFLLNPGSFI